MVIPPRGTLLIDHPAQLRVLLSDVPAARRDFRSVRLRIGGLSLEESVRWEARLSRSLRSRGSDSAALGYGAAMLVYGLYIWLNGFPAAANFDALSVGVALGVGGAAVGKMIGLVLANRALHRSATELARLCGVVSDPAEAAPPGRGRRARMKSGSPEPTEAGSFVGLSRVA